MPEPELINPSARPRPKERTLKLRQMFGNMPPRYHWPEPDIPYDPAKSHVIKWLMAHPDTGQIIFNLARNAGAIVYDAQSRKWSGARHVRRNQ